MNKLLVALLASAAFAVPAHANLVTNGSFETGDFSGWTLTGNTNNTAVISSQNSYQASSGSYLAILGPVNSLGGITQTLTTTAGGAYTLSFDLANKGGVPSNYIVSINGSALESMINSAAFAYSTRTFNFTATSEATVLAFTFQQNPDFFLLDNIAVDAAEVPEPAMLGLFGLGAIGLGLARRRKA